MKIKLFTSFIICLLATVATMAQSGKNTGSAPKWTEAQASAIIKYGNQLVEFFNRNAIITRNMESTRNTYEGNKERLTRNADGAVHYLGSNSAFNIPNRNNAIPVAPAAYPDKSVPQLFSDCETIFKKIKTDCETIEGYLKNKTFVTDKFSTSDKLMEGMEQQADSVYTKMRRAINRASKLSSDAEMVFLQKSPIKHLVIPMKTDLSAFRDILNELEAASAIKVADQQVKLAGLKERYEKNKTVEGKDFSKKDIYYKTDVYPKFYQNLLSAVAAVEKYYQLLEADKDAQVKDEDREAEATQRINNYYSSAFSYYNNAIDSYNTFIRN